ncbi:hypothetical protein MMC20_001679 [Loxospora ochrophaea]|nr:hypothetical protein [Loxospora ochrophaea]
MQDLETAPETQQGTAHRRGVPLPPIQTSFSSKTSQRVQRPPPIETIIYETPSDREPLSKKHDSLRRRSSKSGFLGLFGRTKSTKKPRAKEQLHTLNEGQEHADRPTTKGASVSSKNEQELDAFKSHPNSRKSTESTSNSLHPSSRTTRTKSLRKELSVKSSTSWEPPPLFQAYPQAIKYAALSAPAMSADAIIRMQTHNRNSNLQQGLIRDSTDLDSAEPANENSLQAGSEKKHKRRKSSSSSLVDWTRKIYVLVTSGYFLQYAGDGSFDRHPEKILRLGKDSAAFASDAISGKHWVLQVSDASDENGPITTKRSNSVFAKLGLRGDSRRSTSTLLLVLDSPGEMDSWLVAVRKEIEALGGKKYRPDIGKRKTPDEIEHELRERPSRRYLVKRDPNQFCAPQDPQISFSAASSKDEPVKSSGNSETAFGAPLTDENLFSRDNEARSTTSIPAKRRSMRNLPTPLDVQRKSLDLRPATKSPRPGSTYSSSGISNPSPVTPNFSVPSFSKRYSHSSAINMNSELVQPTDIDEIDSPGRRTSVIGELPSSFNSFKFATPHIRVDSEEFSLSSSTVPASHNPSHHSRPILPNSDSHVPRRFSSLEYSRGKLPYATHHTPSPHPPPTTALPAVPDQSPSKSVLPSDRPTSQGQPQKHKLRRPTSMQVRSDPLPRYIPRASREKNPALPLAGMPTSNSGTSLPTTQDRKLPYRKSMPHFAVSKPPTGPLPPIPTLSIVASQNPPTDIPLDSRWPASLNQSGSFHSVQVS